MDARPVLAAPVFCLFAGLGSTISLLSLICLYMSFLGRSYLHYMHLISSYCLMQSGWNGARQSAEGHSSVSSSRFMMR